MVKSLLQHPVTVVVPVYNASEEVRALVASLEQSAPTAVDGLSFLFADDGSVEPGLRDVWTLPFFSRADVRVRHGAGNAGFIGNVNLAVAEAPPFSDVVILNSDTRVFGDLFTTLQEEAYSAPRIASVTPLTNNGTIASLFGFPGGEDLPPKLAPQTVANVVEKLDLASPHVWAPTGVGYCLYLRRDAISALGLFDPIYGRGYGEESDWCQRAQAHGWRHLISTRSFVYHAGTKSFSDAEKVAAVRRNTKLVLSRYPKYLDEVKAYCARDPLKFHRLRILLELLRYQSRGEIVLFALHADPDARYVGGTERHVRQLQQIVAEQGTATVEIFPQAELFRVRGFYQRHRYFDETFDQTIAESLFALLSESIGAVHAHHFRGWSEASIDSLTSAPIRTKIFTLHDFAPLCPSGFLLAGDNGSRFCEVEADPKACNHCLQSCIRYSANSIEGYRAQWLPRVASFDRIVVPSRAMLPSWRKGLELANSDLFPRIKVLEHDLTSAVAMSRRSMPWIRKEPSHLVAFVGGFGKPKGSELIIEATPLLRKAGFEVEIVGYFDPSSDPKAARIRMTRYQNPAELLIWLQRNAPMIVAHPSLAAESFCFAFYECLLFSETAIPVVGRFGNPADVIRETGAGVVMAEMSAAGLVSACEQARDGYSRFAAKRAHYREQLRSSARDYPKEYLSLIAPTSAATSPGTGTPIDLVALEASDFAARASRQPNGRPLSLPTFRENPMANAQVPELERLTTETFTMGSVEHLHRYAIAADICCGKDALDIASGEGYGSNLLAKTARNVVGVDISSEVVEHANAKYARANLTFRQGAAGAIPLDDASVDVVVSFETLEHHDKHEDMLAEIKRILRPNGVMIISTPDKLFYSDTTGYRNIYHVKELYLDEFKGLVQRFFTNHRILFQGVSCGTFVVSERDWRSFSYYRGDYHSCEPVNYLPKHVYNIAIASDGDLPEIGVSFFDGEQAIRDYRRQMEDSVDWESIPNLQNRLRAQQEVIHDLEQSVSYRLGRLLTWPLRQWSGR